MRIHKLLFVGILIAAFIVVLISVNNHLIPAIRLYHAQQLSPDEYGGLVQSKYPSFDPSKYELKDVRYLDEGFLTMVYISSDESHFPLQLNKLCGDSPVIEVFRYDALGNSMLKLL